jgi:hypothetical protein
MTARVKIKKHWSTRMSGPNERVAMTDDGAFPALSAKTIYTSPLGDLAVAQQQRERKQIRLESGQSLN